MRRRRSAPRQPGPEFSLPIHVTIPGDPSDPRVPADLPPWVVAHYVPELHPDDLDVVEGLPCTSLARTLIDMAECSTEPELWDLFARTRDRGLLDAEAIRASRGRVEWRPSLGMFDRVAAQFLD